MHTFRIAILDDDEYYRRTLVEILNKEKLFKVVLELSHTGTILEDLREFKPDLLILDIAMPREDGITVLRKIKAEDDLSYLAVLMLTAHNEPDLLGESVLQGQANGYITKDESPDIIVKGITSILLRNAGPVISTGLHNLSGVNYLQPEIDFSRMRPLAGQEIKIARMLVNKIDYAEITKRCNISRSTTYTHIRNIKAKLHFRDFRKQVKLQRFLELYLEYYSSNASS